MQKEVEVKEKEEKFFTVKEVAKRFKVHPNIIYRAIKDNTLKPNIFGKHAIRFSTEELERYEHQSTKNGY